MRGFALLKARIHYKLWLASYSLRNYFRPVLNKFVDLLQKQLLLAVVLISAAIGFRYYVQGADDELDANASMETAAVSGVESGNTISNEASQARINKNKQGGSALAQNQSKAQNKSKNMAPPTRETALEHAKKHLDPTYVCPMHPEIISKDPEATCPICGMDLVPLESGGDTEVVTLTPRVVNMLGVRTGKVKRRTIYRRIDSVGYVQFDENQLRTISLRTDGWIEKLAVKSVGERIKKGDLLFAVYSPTLVNAQEEYISAMEMANKDLLDASRDRLRALGVSDSQIKQLRATRKVEQRIKVFAPQDGIISELNVREGAFVPPSKPIVNIVDLSSVWLIADVFERQAEWVKQGIKAEATLPFLPDKTFKGKVEFVYPELDPKTRSLKVRLRFDNAEEILKPNMYADVTIYAKPKRKTLIIPREALIRTGDNDRVILAMGEGRFKPAIVHVGIETNNQVEILHGLEEGQEVVVSSQFLIDSESSLRASILRMGGS